MSNDGNIKTEIDADAYKPRPKIQKGRKKNTEKTKSKPKEESMGLKQELITNHMPVVKKKRKIDRFNGMPEEEVLLKLLPDRLAPNLDILIIGINPGLFAAYIGHHYAGPGNHFWKCLYLSGLVPEPMNCYDDIKLQEFGIGFTNMCDRTTRGSADLKRTEILEGGTILREKLKEYKPKIAVFNGKGIYEIFSGNKKFTFGKQPGLIEGTGTIAYVMPSSSARCSQLPRAVDKVPFYVALRKLRDYVTGRIPQLDEADVTFPTLELKTVKKEEPASDPQDDTGDGYGNLGSGALQDDADDEGDYLAAQSDGLGANLPTSVEKEGTKGAKVKGKRRKNGNQQETASDSQLIMEEPDQRKEDHSVSAVFCQGQTGSQQITPHLPSQSELQQTFAPIQMIEESSGNSFMSTDFTFLRPAVSGSSNFLQSLPATSWPDRVLASGSATTPQQSQDFMAGFYPGSHQFGMVGVPGVVASQQNYIAPADDCSEKSSIEIKSEPVELEAQI